MTCDKNCIANLNGECCVDECKGQLVGFGFGNQYADKEQRSRLYEIASVMFEEDFVPSKTSVIRDKVNGKEIYCRVPIRRKRTQLRKCICLSVPTMIVPRLLALVITVPTEIQQSRSGTNV